jgi:transcriptional regulator with XRE-family HTH domain
VSENGGMIKERIKQLRALLRLSQQDFAAALKLSNAYISEIEQGKRLVNERVIHLIALTYGVNEAWLSKGERPIFEKLDDVRAQQALKSFMKLDGFFQEFILRQMDFIIAFQDTNKTDEG